MCTEPVTLGAAFHVSPPLKFISVLLPSDSVLSSSEFHLVMCLNGFFFIILMFPPFSSALSLTATLRSPVQSLLAFFISSSWLPSPGCVWRVCNSISCSWRSLRASTRAKSTTICAATASPHWWWASLRP